MGSTNNQFQVIGVGLPRTGTNSLKTVFEKLFPGKCYHMFETFPNDHDDIWYKIYNDKLSDEEFAKFFLSNGYIAGIDYPFTFCLEQAMRAFPDAKVVLSVRDAHNWIQSVKQTVLPVSRNHERFPIVFWKKLGLFRRSIPWWKFDMVEDTKNQKFQQMLDAIEQGRGLQFFEEWTQYVKQVVPKEKLLVYSVKEGWEPLCKFLNLPIPNEKFPHVNTQDEFYTVFGPDVIQSWLLLYEVLTIPSLIYLWYKYLK